MTGDDTAEVIRVLIADGDARVRIAVRIFLTASPGFDVVAEADSAAAALELAREHAPTVVIVGDGLPGASAGLSLLNAITSELHIPAVVMSMRGGLRGQALAAHACQFVEKDGSPDLLLAALRTAARR